MRLHDYIADEVDLLKKENEKLKRQLQTAQKVAVYFYNLPYGVRPSIVMGRIVKKYKEQQKKGGAG